MTLPSQFTSLEPMDDNGERGKHVSVCLVARFGVSLSISLVRFSFILNLVVCSFVIWEAVFWCEEEGIKSGIADLSLEDEEEDAFTLPEELDKRPTGYKFCLVRCFLTASVVHFPAMKNILANIWHPLEGVQILNLGKRHFLFKFFNELDISQVITGAPWTFNKHLLIFQRIQENKDPMAVPLGFLD
ncbi:hypothetical protein PVK06_046571 [Gossypium arboreum]|uniref:DUF4283 domain-containing protein n=1 Tax=Gossypium arboreum TaxID=29729 RepID=A0ABR0MB07_GOSAR|nr:hypothetical protein PVK06_046571 [Gossypium arboreum]